MHYKHLTIYERKKLAKLRKKGLGPSEIARRLRKDIPLMRLALLTIAPSGLLLRKQPRSERIISIGSESLQVSVLPYRFSICVPVR